MGIKARLKTINRKLNEQLTLLDDLERETRADEYGEVNYKIGATLTELAYAVDCSDEAIVEIKKIEGGR